MVGKLCPAKTCLLVNNFNDERGNGEGEKKTDAFMNTGIIRFCLLEPGWARV